MVLLHPPTCSFGIPAELRSRTSAMNFQGPLSPHSAGWLWSEEYDTIDRLPLLLQLFSSLLYYNTLFFSSVSNIYSTSTLPLNLGHLRNSLIVHYRHTCSPNAMASRTFRNHDISPFLLLFHIVWTQRLGQTEDLPVYKKYTFANYSWEKHYKGFKARTPVVHLIYVLFSFL